MSAMTHDNAQDVTRRTIGGFGLALVSAVSFALSGPIGRGLLDAGWSPAAAVAARVLVGGAALVPPALVVLRGRWPVLRRSLPVVLLYGLVPVAGTQFAYFTAIRYLPVGIALLVEFTSPIAVVVWLWLRHAQRPTGLTVAGALLGMTGLVLVLDLGAGTLSGIGIAWALLAMLGAATYFVLSARVDAELPGVVLAAAGLLVGGVGLLVTGAVGLLPLATSAADVALGGVTMAWWVPMLTLGLVTAALSYATGIGAARRLGARLASFCGLTELVAALVLAWLLLAEVPRPMQIAGAVLVLAGVAAVRLGERVPGEELTSPVA
ncbi:EamA family transporter [Pseudonocardia sp. CA-107938]|uniref:EamA family transporter n=1 Tax=Pseudonocardia sp. CA-107938 TaxID=3240021 RepID=UPI003D93D121